MPAAVTLVTHPLLQDALARLRDRETPPPAFRTLLRLAGLMLGAEALKDLPLRRERVVTPLTETEVERLAGPLPAFVTILRAGNGLLEGLMELLPEAPVGHLGLYRDHVTLEAVEYYRRLPPEMEGRVTLVCDPMLATAHTSIAALNRLREAGVRDLRYLCLLAAPEGVAALQAAHPEVPIWTAAVDQRLNERGYIVPGLGDAGDRLYGTA